MYTYKYKYMYVYMCVCIYICIYIPIGFKKGSQKLKIIAELHICSEMLNF